MQRQPVDSESLESVGYEKGVLEVRFRNGGLYRYFDVPGAVYRLLVAAESKGRFFNRQIRGHYECQRLERGRVPVHG